MFLIAGILLLSIIYLLAAQALHEGSELPFKIVTGNVQRSPANLPGCTAAAPATSSTPR